MAIGDLTDITGLSPITQALIDAQMQAFNVNALPVIQNQFALQGLANSPALGQAVGQSLATAFPGFIQTGESLGQSQAGLAANIGNQEAMRQLQAAQLSGNLLLGLGQNVLSPAAQFQSGQAQLGLGALGGAGQLQQGLAQSQAEATQMDFLRRQGLAEQGTTGLFGGSVLPPTLSGTSTTNTTGGGSSK